MPLYNPPSSPFVQAQVSTGGATASFVVGSATTVEYGADTDRRGLTLINKSSNSIYVGCDVDNEPSAANHFLELRPDAYFEFPSPIYVGSLFFKAAFGANNVILVTTFT
jgi:hypothetical protein